MAIETLNRLRRASGLLPKGVLELGLDDDGMTAWCRYGGEDGEAQIELDMYDAQGSLARDLMAEHGFKPLLAVEAARHLCSEHRRRTTRH
jgi:hypothetical protein